MEGPRYCSWAPDRLLREPAVRRMNAEAFGGYCSLLVEMWLDEEGSLSPDVTELALLSRLGQKGWAKYSSMILPLFYYNQSGRVCSEIIDEARERVLRKSEAGKKAVEARKAKYRQLEPKKGSNDHRTIIERLSNDEQESSGRSSKEKEKEKVKEKEPPTPLPPAPPTSSPPPAPTRARSLNVPIILFEEYWASWKGLGGKTTLNKKATLESYRKALRRGATEEDLATAVKVYDRYLAHRCKHGKPDSRDFIPMPETWLNQDRWQSEYPEDVLEGMAGDPVSGRDFYWREFKDHGQVSVGRYRLDASGAKTETPFDLAAWRKEQKL